MKSNHVTSKSNIKYHGVLQKLGPRLFKIHVFDLPEVPGKGELEMFVDDTEHYVIW